MTKQENYHYQIFQGLLMLAFFLHVSYAGFLYMKCTLALLLLGYVTKPALRSRLFGVFLIISFTHLLVHMPNHANHSNFTLLVLLALAPVHFCYLLKINRYSYKQFIYFLRIMLIVLYAYTFFHKLNWDFLNYKTSCANSRLKNYYILFPDQFKDVLLVIKKMAPTSALLIEGSLPVLLSITKLRFFGLCLAIFLHFFLAPLNFVNFSSLALALLWCFIEPKKINFKSCEKFLGYLILIFISSEFLVSFFQSMPVVESYFEYRDLRRGVNLWGGFLFIAAYALFVKRFYIKSISKEKIIFPTQWLYHALIVFTIFFGANNYLGLRAAGTFSMFSNLKTEGDTSNHIIFRNNPLKLFSYQEDLVEIVSFDENASKAGIMRRHKRQKTNRIDFSKRLDQIRKLNLKNVGLTIKYKGQLRSTKSAGFDKNFDIESHWLEKKLMQFRPVENLPEQRCMW